MIVHSTYRGVLGYSCKEKLYFLSEYLFCLTYSVDPDEMQHMLHFILVFTVYKSTCFGVSRIQSVIHVHYFMCPVEVHVLTVYTAMFNVYLPQAKFA